MLVNNLPLFQTKGFHCLSSSSPGASHTNKILALKFPSPTMGALQVLQRLHLQHFLIVFDKNSKSIGKLYF